jgi:N-acetylmuramoyl-L-alanine amidase
MIAERAQGPITEERCAQNETSKLPCNPMKKTSWRWPVLAWIATLCVVSNAPAENLSPLATRPHWQRLDRYQETISRADFTRLLDSAYATRGYGDLIVIGEDSARIVEDRAANKFFELRFADNRPCELPYQYWRPLDKIGPTKKPLAHVHIALDPGHLGGNWAKMEERWFQVDNNPPVEEGGLTWRVAKILAPKLRARGAEVSFVRKHARPMTPLRPDDFREIARAVLAKTGVNDPVESYENAADENKERSVRWQSELLFYRQSEIRYRARRVNEFLQPDIVLCLHFNAEDWGDPKNPTLIERNHFHVLVNGSYLPDELEHDDVRYEMIRRLLSRTYDEELPLADAMALTFARETGLPPYQYTTDTVTKAGSSGYVYARNLLATRLYRCPVIYFEPYVMNSNEAFARIEAGDYIGTREINGGQRPSIFREYAQAVADGLVEYLHKTP